MVIACIALFVAIGGGAYAAGLAKDSVRSKQVKNGSLKGKDLKEDTLVSKQLKDGAAVGSSDVIDDSLTGADINESQLTLPPDQTEPTGPAGGSLTGTYPNPTLAASSVGATEIQTSGVGETEIAPDSVSADELLGISTVSATSAVTANNASTGVTAECPGGSQIISGGYETGVSGNQNWNIRRDFQFGNGWRVFGANQSGGDGTITVFAYCLVA